MIGSINISNSYSKVTSLPNDQPVIRDSRLDNGRFLTMVNVGDRIGTFYGLRYLGVYSTDADAYVMDANGNMVTDFNGDPFPIRWNNQEGLIFTGGDAHYDDLNNDGIINSQDVVAIGNSNPDFYGGFMFRLTYNNAWDLLTTFNYQYGFDIVNVAKMTSTNMYTDDNQTQAVMRRWRKQGDVTDIPRALYGAGHNWAGSDRYVEDGSYIKFNSLTLSYNFQRAMLDRLNMRSTRLSFTIQNVYIMTNYSGVDPSVGANRNDMFTFGQDNAYTPNPITYTFSMVLNF